MAVPLLSILFMGVSALLAIGVPIALLILFHKRYGAKVVPALVGVVAFIVFALVLEQIMHLLVLQPAADGTVALKSRPFLYMLYASFAAGVFEETARFLSFLLLRRKYAGVETALSYGAGHGGIESILIGGLSILLGLVTVLRAGTVAQDAALAAQIRALAATPSYLFLISGLERMLALTIQISLSVLVYYSVYENRRIWLFPAAILFHALVDAPAVLAQLGLIGILPVEAIVLVFAVGSVMLAVYTHRRLKPLPREYAESTFCEEAESASREEAESTLCKEAEVAPREEAESAPRQEAESTLRKEVEATLHEEAESAPREEAESAPREEAKSSQNR